VRIETSPDDVHGMLAARGVLTARGGATSHAAVVARSMGLPCVAGAESLRIDYAKRQMRAGEVTVAEGDMISIDGTTGEISAGERGKGPAGRGGGSIGRGGRAGRALRLRPRRARPAADR